MKMIYIQICVCVLLGMYVGRGKLGRDMFSTKKQEV